MSTICNNGWGEENYGAYSVPKECPAMGSCGYEGDLDKCNYGFWHEQYVEPWVFGGPFAELVGEIPDSCPYASILKALPGASEDQLTAIREVIEKITDIAEERQVCPECGGSGEGTEELHVAGGVMVKDNCPTCGGTEWLHITGYDPECDGPPDEGSRCPDCGSGKTGGERG